MLPEFGEIILVGFEPTLQARRLVNLLGGMDLPLTHVKGADGVLQALRLNPKATIVVYSPGGGHVAEDVLEQVELAHRGTPVVALVDHGTFGEYYSLMNQGAVEYFEVGETPAIIARGVEWAARRLSA